MQHVALTGSGHKENDECGFATLCQRRVDHIAPSLGGVERPGGQAICFYWA